MSDKHYVHPHDENELAKVIKQSRPWFDQYGTTAIYGLAALLAVAAIVVYIRRTPPATAAVSAAWIDADSSAPESYRDIADQFPDTALGTRARLKQADLLMSQASLNLFRNRKIALEEIDSAQKAYERLADRRDLPADLRQLALAGLARAKEAVCDGSDAKTKAATEAWKKLLDEFPDSKLFKETAEERIKHLQREDTRAFYAWFQKQDPKPGDDSLLPQDGKSAVPAVPPGLPDLSKLGIPDLGSLGEAANDAAKGTSPLLPAATSGAAPAPSAPAGTSDAAKPAEVKPADAKPAETPAVSEPKTDAAAPQVPQPGSVEPAAPASGTPAPGTAAEAAPGNATPAQTPAPAAPAPATTEPGKSE